MNDALRKALQRTPECPPAETLIGVMEDGEHGDRAVLEAHLRSCSFCQTELALYRGFEAGEIRSDERAAVDFIVGRLRGTRKEVPARASFWQRFFTPGWMGGAALAMAALLLTIGLTSQWRVRQSPVPASDDGALRSTALTITSPVGVVGEVPDPIRWQPVDGAAEYTITLTEVDRTVIFHKNVTTTELLLPSDARTLLRPGKKVLLEVTARNRAGAEIARSGAVSVQLALPANKSH